MDAALELIRGLRVDERCLGDGGPCWAHVCVGPPLRFDEPEVQQVRRDALAWWIPLLGPDYVCLSMLTADQSRCAGAVTVALSPQWFESDPFARLFSGRAVQTRAFVAVAPPPGPVIERVGGIWPG